MPRACCGEGRERGLRAQLGLLGYLPFVLDVAGSRVAAAAVAKASIATTVLRSSMVAIAIEDCRFPSCRLAGWRLVLYLDHEALSLLCIICHGLMAGRATRRLVPD